MRNNRGAQISILRHLSKKDIAGFSTQRCDGIYIRRIETCARSMQRIFRCSSLILMQKQQQQQQLFRGFQKLLGYCQP